MKRLHCRLGSRRLGADLRHTSRSHQDLPSSLHLANLPEEIHHRNRWHKAGQCGHQDTHQQRYDRNHDQQLDQCKTFPFLTHFLSPLPSSRFAHPTILRPNLVMF
jgi:hypothetical protein